MMETRSGFCHVATETRQRILECISEILTVIQQKDWEEFRGTVGQGAVLFANLARSCEVCASLSYEDLVSLIDSRERTEQERALGLLVGLKEFLPYIGSALSKVSEMFPKSQGGHPASLKGLDSKRRLCRRILELIASGETEAEAKKLVAKELIAKKEVADISPRTIHRIWKERAELEKQSFEDFFSQFLKSLNAPKPTAFPSRDANSTESTENPA
jgi:hypothetical protein